MSLRRLCFVLPMDGDEVVMLAYDHERRRRPRMDGGKVGSYVRAKVSRALSFCLRCSGCRANSSGTGLFEDIAGVHDETSGGSTKIGGGAASGPRVFSYSELYIGTSGFSDKEVLGTGGFGRVYRAVLPSDGTTVAVKCVASAGDRFEKSFLAELAAVACLRHRNLVRLRGWCVRDEEELLLVYDYMPNRSLDRQLFSASALSWDRRRRIVAGLAAALFYLHEQLDTQIIHRDVKTSNVMLDSEYNARLGDFGLARWLEHAVPVYAKDKEDAPQLQLLPSPHSMRSSSSFSSSARYQFRLVDTSKMGGTIGYLPPESFQRRGSMATAKSDVFSFGIVLLEVATGRRAVDLAYPDDQIIMLDWVRRLSDEEKLLKARDRKLPDNSYPLFDMERVLHLGLLCSMHDPRDRPTMKWVVENISDTCSGELPLLPSFSALPKYISLTSSSDSGTMTATITMDSSTALSKPMYATAAGTTIYLTADEVSRRIISTGSDTPGEKTDASNQHLWRTVPITNVDTPREISYKEIVAITNDFSQSQVVAELDFGTGYEGYLYSGHTHGHVHVLVKRLGMKTCPALRVRFANELCNLAKLRHRNLVQLRGWCTQQGEMLVVYDHSPGTLLSHHLLLRHSVLSWRHRYDIVKALASAILYLHEEWDEQVIHRNITSSAVFLDHDRSPRLGSFALAEFLSRNEHNNPHVVLPTSSARGIFGYMSPEYIESGVVTTMADVYSFGVVVLEVLTGTMAVDMISPEVLLVRKVHHQLCQDQKHLRHVEAQLVDRRLDGRYDRQEVVRMAKVGIACTQSDPAARPTMRKTVSILDGNDEMLHKLERRTESMEEWERKNASALSLVRRLQALCIN